MPHAQISTPDFETYSMAIPAVQAAITDDTVTVTWSDGRQGRFHHIWLFDNQPEPPGWPC